MPYIKRKIEGTILKRLKEPEILAVVGPRQSGKTTLLKRICGQVNKDAILLTFEDKEILVEFERNIKGFIKKYGSYRYIFIDEFQHAKNGGQLLKFWYDTHPNKIMLAGSSAIDLTVKALRYLVGRILIYELYPLDFAEFLSFKDSRLADIYGKAQKTFPVKPDLTAQAANRLQGLYQEYLMFGGYPRVVTSETPEEKISILKNIYNTFFLREVRDILGLIEDYKLLKLTEALAGQIGNMIVYRELAALSELEQYAVKKYLNFFQKTFICRLTRPFHANRRLEIVKNPKIYFIDTGLRNLAANNFQSLKNRNDKGCLLENGVAMELIKREQKFNYWRSKKQQEVDFVIELPQQKKQALEVKSQLSRSDLQSKSAKEFARLYPQIPLIYIYLSSADDFSNTYPVYLF